MPSWLWALAAVLLVAGEFATGGFWLLMLAVGAAVAAGVGLVAPDVLLLQVGAFALTAGLMTWLVRPKLAHKLTTDDSRFGPEALPGRQGESLERVDASKGVVKVAGQTWSAKLDTSLEATPIDAGERVVVERVAGAFLVVRRADYFDD